MNGMWRRHGDLQHAKRADGTAGDVVAMCQQLSSRLEEQPLDVKLHTRVGRLADGTLGLETNGDGLAELVVNASGSHLFGLVKRDHRHTFAPGDLEKTGTQTAFMLRSIRALTKGDDAAKDEMLGRSLSLIHESEAVAITFESKATRDQLGDWIDAKWSVSKIQQSFRRDERTTLALQGKRQTLNQQDFYQVTEAIAREDTKEQLRLPRLEPELFEKLQDDLLNGIHVTYHDNALEGLKKRSRPCRLRHDFMSKEGLIILEPSFTDGAPVVSRPVSDLVQVGGGPSADSITALLLRATSKQVELRACAVSLVFKDVSMDITCSSPKDARELVLFFSEAKGFTRAGPPPSSDSLFSVHSSITPSEHRPLARTATDPSPAPKHGLGLGDARSLSVSHQRRRPVPP